MSGVGGAGGPRCQAALAVLASLCRARPPPLGLDVETCRSFELQPPERTPSAADAVVVIVCGVALVAVFLFLFWKLCWMPWRNKEASSPSANAPLEALPSPSSRGNMADKLKDPNTLGFLEAAVKISHTSPDIPAEVQMSVKEHIMRHTRLQRQTTEPASSTRHTSFKRHLPRQMHVSSVDYGNELPPAAEQPTSIGRIKPELYKQKSVDGDDAKSEAAKSCGKLNFSLRYDYESETLIVRILKAFDLPAKDFCGSSDPYVKIYLLPDRKCKLQTRVHRKTLNPTFDENFHFPVPYEELADRKLHLSVFDFDRFSRHDMIGEVILDNLFEASDLSRETSIWKDIQYATSSGRYGPSPFPPPKNCAGPGGESGARMEGSLLNPHAVAGRTEYKNPAHSRWMTNDVLRSIKTTYCCMREGLLRKQLELDGVNLGGFLEEKLK
ncbi:Synaptotagmin-6 [Tupaia chinensis]|uniref:Synaptotagmin-6 n=1 Tax=Tupaia chinensis TaxID=246437 RepID=L9KQQ5_TUPCH|nr:Synaptotagmin-6 [Tupaia chinensis]